jgi:heme exporter protein A
MLAVEALHCRRGGRTVFANLSFELSPGEGLELRGANGSGKTSLLRILAGLAPLSKGKLLWNEHAVQAGDFDHAARIAYLGHLNGLSADLSASENLRFSQQLGGGASTGAALQAWGLADMAGQAVRLLSQGQRRRLALARVWSSRRQLWLLDEPCAALDNAGEQLFDNQLDRHLEAGGMAVVATHRALNAPAAALQRIDLDSLGFCSEVAIAAC